MIALSLCPKQKTWNTVSFPSTLHLHPVLDLLLKEIPGPWQPELRLGLQEALVNAAKHGNEMDPSKIVMIRFTRIQNNCWWIITDQGSGFSPPACEILPDLDGTKEKIDASDHPLDCGRGLFLLHAIFDQVQWNPEGTQLTLYKQVDSLQRLPLFM